MSTAREIVLSLLSGLAGSVRESLPTTEDDAGQWLAGLCWGFVLHWGALILVTYAWARSTGAH
jgi:hypothetical protein